MKMFTRSLMVMMAVASVSSLAKADMIFKKDSEPTVRLILKDDKTASIKMMVPDGGDVTLTEGSLEGENSSLTLQLPEGDVCPSYEIELFHDIKLGENQSAAVRAKVEDTGSAARQYCGNLQKFDGSYTRAN